MVTYEIEGTTKDQRETLRDFGFTLERLDNKFWNVSSCEDEDADALDSVLENLGIKHRMV